MNPESAFPIPKSNIGIHEARDQSIVMVGFTYLKKQTEIDREREAKGGEEGRDGGGRFKNGSRLEESSIARSWSRN